MGLRSPETAGVAAADIARYVPKADLRGVLQGIVPALGPLAGAGARAEVGAVLEPDDLVVEARLRDQVELAASVVGARSSAQTRIAGRA